MGPLCSCGNEDREHRIVSCEQPYKSFSNVPLLKPEGDSNFGKEFREKRDYGDQHTAKSSLVPIPTILTGKYPFRLILTALPIHLSQYYN
jgi:hypothetical protein